MHLWLQLASREGAFLLLLLALGSGPAAYLPERFDAISRLAMAPLLGFCVGMSVTTTLVEFWSANSTHWILVPVCAASLALAAWRIRRARPWRSMAPRKLIAVNVVQVLIVGLVVAGPLTLVLHERHTVGPAVFTYTDVDGYVAEQDGEATRSAHDATDAWNNAKRGAATFPNLTQYNWGFRAQYDQNLDATPLDASVAGILGLGATDTFDPFLIMILLCGALGVFACVRYATQSSTWAAALAAALFGGPFFLELFYDTYQAAICGLALVIPLLVLWFEALRTRHRASLVLCALVLSAFLTVYPLFVPLVGLAAIAVFAWLALKARRSGAPLTPYLRSIGLRLLVLAVLAIAFEPVAFVRDLTYAKGIIENTIPLPRVSYHLRVAQLPGLLLQTRGFWNMSSLGSSFKQLVLGGFVPLVFIGVIVYGLRRYRLALGLVALAAICALVAEYSFASQHSCTYCAERNLLPLAPIGIVLLALGIYALSLAGWRLAPWLAAAAALLVILAVGQRTRVELDRYSSQSYFLDSGNRAVLSKVPRTRRAIALEGYGMTLSAQAEEALVYFLANERLHNPVSLVTAVSYGPGLAYLTFDGASGPWPPFDPNYLYVLTRFGGVRTSRRVIARDGPFALEARGEPLDVLPVYGLLTSLARLDPDGTPWAQPPTPMVFYLTGSAPARRVWAKLSFAVREPVKVAGDPGVRAVLRGRVLTACVPAVGSPPLRVAKLALAATPLGGPVPRGSFPPPQVPLKGIALTGMRAVLGACSP